MVLHAPVLGENGEVTGASVLVENFAELSAAGIIPSDLVVDKPLVHSRAHASLIGSLQRQLSAAEVAASASESGSIATDEEF